MQAKLMALASPMLDEPEQPVPNRLKLILWTVAAAIFACRKFILISVLASYYVHTLWVESVACGTGASIASLSKIGSGTFGSFDIWNVMSSAAWHETQSCTSAKASTREAMSLLKTSLLGVLNFFN